MHYKLLLAFINYMLTFTEEFDARSVYQYILTKSAPQALKTSIKLISNDLGRLYRMQLVSRKKVKRVVGDGYSYRGFMYSYRLNKQGKSYINYLGLTLNSADLQRHRKKYELRTNVHTVLPIWKIEENMGDKLDDLDTTYAEYAYLNSDLVRGRYKRFPVKISFTFVKELIEKKHRLEEENEKLKTDLMVCRKELDVIRRRPFF